MLAAVAMVSAMWLDLFRPDPVPAWTGNVAVAVVVAAVVAAIVLCFIGPIRRRWRFALAFPLLTFGAAGMLPSAFEELALADRGVHVECTVVSKRHYFAHYEDGDEPMTDHRLRCGDWGATSHATQRDEEFAVREVVVAVFDPLGRADPNFGEPRTSTGLLLIPLSALFALGAIACQLYLVDGTFAAAIRARVARIRAQLRL